MLSTTMALLLATALGQAGASKPDGPSQVVVLLAEEAEYKAQPAKEEAYEGWLEYNVGGGLLGLPSRPYVYRLVTISEGKLAPRMLYLAGREPLLAFSVGKEVRVDAKLATVDVEGTKVEELWPARITVLPTSAEGRQLRVIARMANSIVDLDQTKVQAQAFVFRDPAALARACNYAAGSNVTPEQYGTVMFLSKAQGFSNNVKSIDWSKQMLLVIAAGSKVRSPIEAYRLSLNDGQLEVHWRIKGAAGQVAVPGGPNFGKLGNGLSQGAAETIIIPRFDGGIRVIQEGAANNPIVLPTAGKEEAKPK